MLTVPWAHTHFAQGLPCHPLSPACTRLSTSLSPEASDSCISPQRREAPSFPKTSWSPGVSSGSGPPAQTVTSVSLPTIIGLPTPAPWPIRVPALHPRSLRVTALWATLPHSEIFKGARRVGLPHPRPDLTFQAHRLLSSSLWKLDAPAGPLVGSSTSSLVSLVILAFPSFHVPASAPASCQ